jgi:hypothetical protein
LRKICESPVGAIISHAALTRDGRVLVTCESSCLLVWSLEAPAPLHKEFLPDVVQLLLWHDDRRLFVVSEESFLYPMAKIAKLSIFPDNVEARVSEKKALRSMSSFIPRLCCRCLKLQQRRVYYENEGF